MVWKSTKYGGPVLSYSPTNLSDAVAPTKYTLHGMVEGGYEVAQKK